MWIEFVFVGGQLQVQVGEGMVELVQLWDELVCQQVVGYVEDEWGFGGLLVQFGIDVMQLFECIVVGVMQVNVGIGEFYVVFIFVEQGYFEIVFE